jgi:hypothetical protein
MNSAVPAASDPPQAVSRWGSPLVIAVFAAAVAATGNAIVAYTTASFARDLEARKAEQTRILEMIKTDSNPDKAAENLHFLLDAGLIADPSTVSKLNRYLDKRKTGRGAALPAAGGGPSSAPKSEGVSIGQVEVSVGPVAAGSIHNNPHPGCSARIGDGQANCGLVCATVPASAVVTQGDIDLFWNPTGGHVDLATQPYGPGAYGRDDAGPGYHRVEKDFSRQVSGGPTDAICMRVLNWSDTTTRTFLLRVRYR